MKLTTLAIVIMVSFFSLNSCSRAPEQVQQLQLITLEDVIFCYERELWDLISEYEYDIRVHLDVDPKNKKLYNVLEQLALTEQDTLKYVEIVNRKVRNIQDLNDSLRLLRLLAGYSEELLLQHLGTAKTIFQQPAKQHLLDWQSALISDEEMTKLVSGFDEYPQAFENYIRRYIDEVAVERDDSLRVELTKQFAEDYPASSWLDLNNYLKIVSLRNIGEYEDVITLIDNNENLTASLAYLLATVLLSPELRRNYRDGQENIALLKKVLKLADNSEFPEDTETIRVIYNNWSKDYWQNKILLMKAKAIYYQIVYEAGGYWGNEELITEIDDLPLSLYKEGKSLLKKVDFPDNDFGEIAETKYWLGKFAVLSSDEYTNTEIAEFFIDSLIAGAPRRAYDSPAYRYLSYIYEKEAVGIDIMDWCRQLKNYSGPVFRDVTEEAGLGKVRSSRVALADYNRSGYADILFRGRRLFRNNGDFTFTDVTEEAGIVNRNFSGGLWADYNKDGYIDIASFSRNLEGKGNTLFLNNGDGTFSIDNKSDINDYSPTEGAAWVDIDGEGYPSLYLANYEVWQERPGYEDFFWYNKRGIFADRTERLGFRTPEYTTNPGLAGRGVSPADYNNNGRQSLFVSNYRLNRNLLWDNVGGYFFDNAAKNAVHGHLQQGYYGHTIGADWGDFNNNGMLDLFLANLAHPRFLRFSDISMLLENRGTKRRKIGDRSVYYQDFADVTEEAGITFDELHSDPNWFDTNNNSYLDLYITSVYENERSYLYKNNRDGSFTDITFLSGTRVYNGWGNATADFNNNGKLDLIVASGSGVRLFKNITETDNKAHFFMPYWDGSEINLVSREQWTEDIPYSPAFGTKVEVVYEDPKGSTEKLIRELNGGKGTTSQNHQFLHFGIGEGELIEATIWQP